MRRRVQAIDPSTSKVCLPRCVVEERAVCRRWGSVAINFEKVSCQWSEVSLSDTSAKKRADELGAGA